MDLHAQQGNVIPIMHPAMTGYVAYHGDAMLPQHRRIIEHAGALSMYHHGRRRRCDGRNNPGARLHARGYSTPPPRHNRQD